MSQDESHGVVLTGYHSNAELLPKVGPRAPARPSAVDPEPTAPRWDKRVCAGRAQEGGVSARLLFCHVYLDSVC